jgi:hypothetical protein
MYFVLVSERRYIVQLHPKLQNIISRWGSGMAEDRSEKFRFSSNVPLLSIRKIPSNISLGQYNDLDVLFDEVLNFLFAI